MFDKTLELSRWLLSWLSPDWQEALAVPLLIFLLLVALTVLVHLLPVVDRVLAPLGSGLAMALGMVLLLPEYLCTTALRRQRRTVPGILYTYGDGVTGLVHLGERFSRAGLTGFTTIGKVRKLLILTALAIIVATGNADSCAAQGAGCTPPLSAWWTQTRAMVSDEPDQPAPSQPPPSSKPAPSPTPTRKKK
ncbi:hypothetical protein [Dactylosporangium matsuzakiense]|uniref:Uncharacterized protein n=1 Tax=Dactylosporangium matsuzakiense TaxID=53360 RepID=A0A9W6KKC6_9ACTN|nr:hypothetical protein [Dactylosporangium matsuzakiense]UWZ43150.1 hypothetical protein Dmats_37525 [Dactylosporangium matsuzakiense]GLL02763.1 hypothetical protein GCM10017581_045050 [Dactylosporangium matsuzakiense]